MSAPEKARRLTEEDRQWRKSQLSREQRAKAREAARRARDELHELGVYLLNLKDVTTGQAHENALHAYAAQQEALAKTWRVDLCLDGVRTRNKEEA